MSNEERREGTKFLKILKSVVQDVQDSAKRGGEGTGVERREGEVKI